MRLAAHSRHLQVTTEELSGVSESIKNLNRSEGLNGRRTFLEMETPDHVHSDNPGRSSSGPDWLQMRVRALILAKDSESAVFSHTSREHTSLSDS